MKKISNAKWFILGMIFSLIMAALVVPGLAMVGSRTETLTYQDIKITMDGKALVPKDANGNTVEPFIINGTTYLPVRAISEALGLGVSWDGVTSTVKLTSPGTSDGQNPTASTAVTPTRAPTAHYYATSLKEFTKNATGNVSAVLYDIDGCGVDEMIVFDEGISEPGEHWAANAEGGSLMIYSYKNGVTGYTSVDLDSYGFSAYHFYLTSKNFLVLSDTFEGYVYNVYQYKDGRITRAAQMADASYAGETFYAVNGVECGELLFSNKLKEYDADHYTVTIAAGSMQLEWFEEDILPTMQDDTEKILKMTSED